MKSKALSCFLPGASQWPLGSIYCPVPRRHPLQELSFLKTGDIKPHQHSGSLPQAASLGPSAP